MMDASSAKTYNIHDGYRLIRHTTYQSAMKVNAWGPSGGTSRLDFQMAVDHDMAVASCMFFSHLES